MPEGLTALMTFLGVGAVGFFLIISVLFVIAYGNWRGDEFIAFIGVLGVAVMLLVPSGLAPFKYAYNNPGEVLLWVFLYFMIGLIWAIWRWLGIGGFVWKARRRFDEELKKFMNKYCVGMTSVPDSQLNNWIETRKFYQLYPNASENKARITNWIITWPLDMVVWVLGDMVAEVAKFLYRRIANGLDAFTRKYMFKGIDPRLLK